MEKTFVIINRMEYRRWNDSLAIIQNLVFVLFLFLNKLMQPLTNVLIFFSCITRIWLDQIRSKCINKTRRSFYLVPRSFLFVNATDERFNWRKRKTTRLYSNWGGGASYVCDNHLMCKVINIRILDRRKTSRNKSIVV